MDKEMNLLLALHRFAHYQDENFTTAAFINLLRRMQVQCPESLAEVLKLLAKGAMDFSADEAADVEIATWTPTSGGIPDFSVQTKGKLLIVEVKVSYPVNLEQVKNYRKELNGQDFQEKGLTLLTRSPVVDEHLEMVGKVRWLEVTELLDKEKKNCEQPTSFLIEQFLDFAIAQSLMLARVRGKVSEGLRSYQEAHEEDSIFRKRIRNLDVLGDINELRPMAELLEMMKETMLGFYYESPPWLDSSYQGDDWIGYNIDNMRVFFYLRLAEPEVLIFQLYEANIQKEKFDGTKGKLEERYGKLRWNYQLDLASEDANFFSRSRVEQMRILEKFYKESLEYANKLE